MAGDEGDGLYVRPALVNDVECFGAVVAGERVAEQHDVDGGFREQLLDVGEAGGGVNLEARLLEDQAAGVNELEVPAEDEHGSGSGHGGIRRAGFLARGYTVGVCETLVCSLSNIPLWAGVQTGFRNREYGHNTYQELFDCQGPRNVIAAELYCGLPYERT